MYTYLSLSLYIYIYSANYCYRQRGPGRVLVKTGTRFSSAAIFRFR